MRLFSLVALTTTAISLAANPASAQSAGESSATQVERRAETDKGARAGLFAGVGFGLQAYNHSSELFAPTTGHFFRLGWRLSNHVDVIASQELGTFTEFDGDSASRRRLAQYMLSGRWHPFGLSSTDALPKQRLLNLGVRAGVGRASLDVEDTAMPDADLDQSGTAISAAITWMPHVSEWVSFGFELSYGAGFYDDLTRQGWSLTFVTEL